MAVMLKLDEATLAKIKAYATETFEGFDADKTSMFGIKHKTVQIPYTKYSVSFADEPWPRYTNHTFDIPTNWFERFKDKYWSYRLRRLWPIRTKRVVRSLPDYYPGFASLTITTGPHTLPGGEIIEMGYGTCGDGRFSALAVRVVE